MAEKIRSIFERTRPRDLYDIFQLSSYVDRDQVRSIFHPKCIYKGIVPDISMLIDKKDQFEVAWDSSFRHQMKSIPNFQEAYEKMVEVIGYYLG